MLIVVVIKLIAPRIEEIPARCKDKMVKSMDIPECPVPLDRGGYKVHPVPAPLFVMEDNVRREIDGGSSQNLILFIRGKAISGALIIKGSNQLPNPPIKAGISK